MSRRLMIMIAVVAIGALGVAVAIVSLSATPSSLTQSNWVLTRMTVDGQDQSIVPARPPTLRFNAHDRQISGFSGCNSYAASYTIAGARLAITEMRSTAMYCLGDDSMQEEAWYMQALSATSTYQVEGSTLLLTGNNGRDTLTFHAG